MDTCYHCFQEIATTPCPHCGYNPALNQQHFPQALPQGSILDGQYIVGRVLGQGGFGITYLAWDIKSKAKVAIKEFMPQALVCRDQNQRTLHAYSGYGQQDFALGLADFLSEAKTLAKFLGHPNVVAVRTYFEENNTAYFTMEYVSGRSLKAILEQSDGTLPWEETVTILSPIMNALHAVHQAGMIHRDVTPDNIFITHDKQVKLLDFGSARYSLGDRSQSLDVVLKAGYAPVEQYARRGRQGPFTDVYALSATFYATITGYLPPESLERTDVDKLVPISARGIAIPPAVENVILKGLSISASARFASMDAFSKALTQAIAGNYPTEATKPAPQPVAPPVAPPLPLPPSAKKEIPLSLWIALGGVMFTIFVVLMILWMVFF